MIALIVPRVPAAALPPNTTITLSLFFPHPGDGTAESGACAVLSKSSASFWTKRARLSPFAALQPSIIGTAT
jgi:hypothetical protein